MLKPRGQECRKKLDEWRVKNRLWSCEMDKRRRGEKRIDWLNGPFLCLDVSKTSDNIYYVNYLFCFKGEEESVLAF